MYVGCVSVLVQSPAWNWRMHVLHASGCVGPAACVNTSAIVFVQ